jgi:nicotinamidase-related amidase
MIEGSWETEFCDECTPLEGELVVTKRRSSAFVGTDLEQILRSRGIEAVAVVGIVTQGCVEATIRDAAHRDFYNVLVDDCVAGYNLELHEASLKVMRARHDTCTAAEAAAVWGRASGRLQPVERAELVG